MLRTGIALAVLAGTVGCQHMHAHKAAAPPCEPGTAGSQSVCLPPPRIEVQGSSETVVVKAPPQKVVIETPAPPAAAPPPAAPAFPQPAMAYGMPMQAAPFGMAGATVTATSAPRTRLAFAFDSINIPIPWIRAVPVQGEQEFTVRVPTAQVPVMAQPMAFPAMGAMPMTAMPVGAMPAMPTAGVAAAPGVVPTAAAGLVCPPCPPGSGVTPERVQEFARKIAELEEQLKAAKAAAEKK